MTAFILFSGIKQQKDLNIINIIIINKMVKTIECKFCKYVWDYKGCGVFAYCPKCRTPHKVYTKQEVLNNENGNN